ncbi:MAG: MOSC domain-containing protein [Nocardioides sp.]
MAELVAVCVVHELIDGFYHPSAIDKRPVDGPVRITELGPDCDEHVDKAHGGVDGAVYVYAQEDADFFGERLGREIPPGLLGDNLRTTGLDVTGARLGERWRIGDVLLEVRKPRTPCKNLSLRMGVDGFHAEFNRTGRVGALCRVLETGAIRAGDEVVVEHRPDHSATLGDYVTGLSPAQARSLLDADLALVSAVRARAKRAASRG